MAVYFIFSRLASLMLCLTAEPTESSYISRKFQRNLCAVRAFWQEFIFKRMSFRQPPRKPTGVVWPFSHYFTLMGMKTAISKRSTGISISQS